MRQGLPTQRGPPKPPPNIPSSIARCMPAYFEPEATKQLRERRLRIAACPVIRRLQAQQPGLCPFKIIKIRAEPSFPHAAQQQVTIQVGISKRNSEEVELLCIDSQSSIWCPIGLFLAKLVSVHPTTHQDFR